MAQATPIPPAIAMAAMTTTETTPSDLRTRWSPVRRLRRLRARLAMTSRMPVRQRAQVRWPLTGHRPSRAAATVSRRDLRRSPRSPAGDGRRAGGRRRVGFGAEPAVGGVVRRRAARRVLDDRRRPLRTGIDLHPPGVGGLAGGAEPEPRAVQGRDGAARRIAEHPPGRSSPPSNPGSDPLTNILLTFRPDPLLCATRLATLVRQASEEA